MPEQETVETEVVDTEVPPIVETEPEPESEPETFPLEYVQKLRTEAAESRVRAKATDALATRLHASLVAATGRLADPSDLPFDAAHLDDDAAMNTAIDALLVAKPHLASRKPRGDVGQGQSGGSPVFDLAKMLRRRAGRATRNA